MARCVVGEMIDIQLPARLPIGSQAQVQRLAMLENTPKFNLRKIGGSPLMSMNRQPVALPAFGNGSYVVAVVMSQQNSQKSPPFIQQLVQ